VSVGTILTGLGRAIVSWGLGGGDDALAAEFPARIRIPALNTRFHIGDTVSLEGVLVKTLGGTLVDPVSFAVIVQPAVGELFTLVWGTALEEGAGDVVVITAERGTGLYEYSIVTTGARAAEDGQFRVLPRLM
jgi:hypothetical protein